MINKTEKNITDVLSQIKDGATIMIGGFGTAGQPAELIDGLINLGVKDLVIINNNAGNGVHGLARLLKTGAVRKISLYRIFKNIVFTIDMTRDQIAERAAQDIPDGAYVNLGIGLPTKIAQYLSNDKDVFLHSENGLLAFGPSPAKGEEDPELINAVFASHRISKLADDFRVARFGGELDPEHVITPGIFVQHVVQVQPASTSTELSDTAA